MNPVLTDDFELMWLINIYWGGAVWWSSWPLINSIIKDISPLKIRSVVFGLNFFLMFGLSGLAAYMGGVIADNYSFKLIFPIFSLLFPIGIFLLYLLNMKKRVKA